MSLDGDIKEIECNHPVEYVRPEPTYHFNEDQLDELEDDFNSFYTPLGLTVPPLVGLISAAITYWGVYGGNDNACGATPFGVSLISAFATIGLLLGLSDKFEDMYIERARRKGIEKSKKENLFKSS